ncbi:hypothetical protein [Acholeplasma granularum]|uniref:hypothetical protein n=1 Tax=Acholeplasma granularum TaxID=264635 RepID=UPI0004703DD8|nr:hypothetical protein [Acholeplasma granularum]
MKKYLSLVKYEFKTIVKDLMNLFILLYPILMLFICGFLLPAIVEKTAGLDSNVAAITLLIGFVILISIGGFMMGAMLGFSLLDNRDENTLINIAASPVTVSGYATFKIIYTYILAILGNVFMVGGLKLLASESYVVNYGGITIGLLDNLTYGHIIIFSIVSGLIVPFVALALGALAKNKIEGFAMIKGGGLFVMIPMLILLESFQDAKQYIFGIFPNFWTMKAILNLSLGTENAMNMDFWLYMLIGAIYPIILGIIALKMFVKKLS